MNFSRRYLLGSLGTAAALGLPQTAAAADSVYDGFPAQEIRRVTETVLYAHSDLDKLKALVNPSPALANATMDWGFGDWESAIGAAAHMGRLDIAEFLLSRGARPDLFTHAMLGQLAPVRGAIEVMPGIQGVPGPHGITLMAHARAGGPSAQEVVEYLTEVGGADNSLGAAELGAKPEALTGTYAWGTGTGEQFKIGYRRESFIFDREGDFPRALIPSGSFELAARSAPSVRFQFTIADERAVSVKVVDHVTLLTARRTD